MSDARFRPFETHIDEGDALAILRQATAGADDGELFLERRRVGSRWSSTTAGSRTPSYDASEGFGLRAVRGEMAGYAHSTEISRGGAAARRRDRPAGRGRRRRHAGRRRRPHQPAALHRRRSDRRCRASRVKVETAARDRRLSPAPSTPAWCRSRPALAACLQEVEILRPEGGCASPTSGRWCGSTSRSSSRRTAAANRAGRRRRTLRALRR